MRHVLSAATLVVAIALAIGGLAFKLAGAIWMIPDIGNMLWPIWLALGLLSAAGLVAIRTPVWGAARVLAVIAAATLVSLAAPWNLLRWPPDALPETPAGSLRIASFNAWHRNSDWDGALATLTGGQYDVIGIQEARWLRQPQRDALAGEYPFIIQCRGGTILARTLPLASGCSEDPRIRAAWARLKVGDQSFTFVALHFAQPILTDTYLGNVDGIDLLLSQLAARYGADDMILAGDFNTARSSFAMTRLQNRLAPLRPVTLHLRTWPSERLSPIPLLGIDHVWTSPGWRLDALARGPHLGSDHRPVFAALHLTDSEPGDD